MATYTIIGGDGKAYGPITEAQLRQWIADGRANAQSKALAEGATDWKLLSEFPEFFDVLKSTAPPAVHVAATPAPKTSGLAVTALVLGILGAFTCGVTALFGLIFGIIAMVKVKNSGGKLSGNGLALAGIILSLIFVFMIPILAALLLPALANAKQKAQMINCLNNEKQLALAVKIYSDSHTNHYPAAATWSDAIKTYVGSEKVFKCPTAHSGSRCDYAFNTKLDGLDESQVSPNTVIIFEADAGWNAKGGQELLPASVRHHSRRNGTQYVIAFTDGHVEVVPEARLSSLRWDP
jgi:hypothetical protein